MHTYILLQGLINVRRARAISIFGKAYFSERPEYDQLAQDLRQQYPNKHAQLQDQNAQVISAHLQRTVTNSQPAKQEINRFA